MVDIALNGSCLVLLYHRVSEYETDPQLLCVTPENFDKQIEYLKKEYIVLSIEEFCSILSSKKKFPAKSVLLTFDDGYADNFQFALPILERHSTQALFYICTGNLGTDNEFWWDEVERHILLSERFPDSLELAINDQTFNCNNSKEERNKLYHQLLPILRSLSIESRAKVIQQLAQKTGSKSSRSSHRSMTWEELTQMSQSSSAVIGAHTVNHPSLSTCIEEVQKDEISKSKNLLESNLKINVDHFSYPFGTQSDYNLATLKIVKKAGFKMVAANFPYPANRNSDVFQIPRFLVRDWNLEEFKFHLKSFSK